MGLINDKFIMGKKYKSPWGILNSDTGELILTKDPVKTDIWHSLKNVKYFIEDGILFISAKEIKWGWIREHLHSISDWPPENDIYFSTPKFLNKFEIPDGYLKFKSIRSKLWKKRKPISVIDCRGNKSKWFKEKEEFDFTYSLHPFKLREN